MKIRITQSGGFAGVPIELANVDTTTVSPARATRLERLVAKTRFFGLPAQVDNGPRDIGADNAVTYSVTVERASQSHTVAFQDNGSGLTPSSPPDLAALVHEVIEGQST
jgi:hypothetical protein